MLINETLPLAWFYSHGWCFFFLPSLSAIYLGKLGRQVGLISPAAFTCQTADGVEFSGFRGFWGLIAAGPSTCVMLPAGNPGTAQYGIADGGRPRHIGDYLRRTWVGT